MLPQSPLVDSLRTEMPDPFWKHLIVSKKCLRKKAIFSERVAKVLLLFLSLVESRTQSFSVLPVLFYEMGHKKLGTFMFLR